jgi:hypothetical protein
VTGETVFSHAQAYQRWPSAPFPAVRASQPRPAASSVAAAFLQVSVTPRAAVRAEAGRDAQHVRLAAGFQVLPQVGAAAVDLVATGEIEANAVGEHLGKQADGQIPLRRNARSAVAS